MPIFPDSHCTISSSVLILYRSLTYYTLPCSLSGDAGPEIKHSGDELVVAVRGEAELKCVTTDKIEEWYKDGQLLSKPLPSRYSFRKNDQLLLIDNATKTDSGSYTCVASSRLNKTIRLYVEGKEDNVFAHVCNSFFLESEWATSLGY